MLILKKILSCFLILQIVCSQLFPHIIWLYWDSGYQNLGNFQKLCLQRVKQLHKQTDWKIHFLQQKSIDKWLNQNNKKQYKETIGHHTITPQLKTDLLRYYLLKQYGGVWMDISIILKQNLNWVDKLIQNKKVFHRNIFKQPQAFIYFQHVRFSYQTINIQLKSQRYYPVFLVQNAFIVAVKQSKFINDWINQLTDLIKHGKNHYYIEQSKVKTPYGFNNYFMSFRACSINQYRKYTQFLQAKYQNMKLQHLQNHFYNVITMNRQLGLYHSSIDFQRVAEFLIQPEGMLGDYQSPLIKISHGPTNRFVNWLLQNNKTSNQLHYKKIYPNNYQFGKQYLMPQYSCLYSFYINQDSALSKYLLSNEQLARKLFPNLEIVKNSQLPFICRITTLVTLRKVVNQAMQQFENTITLLIILEIIFVYIFFFIKLSTGYNKYLKSVKRNSFLYLVYLKIFFFQINLIFDQYQLWKIQSPTALFVGIFSSLFTMLLIKFFLNLVSKKKELNKQYYLIFLFVLVSLSFYIVYSASVWKYEGQIYNYEALNRLNKKKILELIMQIIKIITFFVVCYFFNSVKRFFKLQKFEKKCQNRYDSDFNQKINGKYTKLIYHPKQNQIENKLFIQSQKCL